MEPTILLRDIVGAARGCILPMAHAVDITAELLFNQHVALDDLKLCEICALVAQRLENPPKPNSLAKYIERWANRCWYRIRKDKRVVELIGREIADIDGPCMILVYLATYAHFDKPYFIVLHECPRAFTGQPFHDPVR